MKKKTSLEEAHKLFNNKNILIFPILNLSQYWEYNEQVAKRDDVKERMKFNKSWFSVKKPEKPEKIWKVQHKNIYLYIYIIIM